MSSKMKKLAQIAALMLSLAVPRLFGNPLESTIIKEEAKNAFDLTGSIDNKSLSLDAFLPVGNDWKVNFSSDFEYTDMPRISNVDFAIGNRNFYIGSSFSDLSSNRLLKNSSMFKVQAGLMPLDWLDFSLTGASINIPNMKTYGYFETPLTLYAIAGSANIGKEFDLKFLKLSPWLSAVGSRYFASAQDTEDLQFLKKNRGYGEETMSYPFNHLNIKGGLDFRTKFFDFTYRGEYDGLLYFAPPEFNFANTLGISFHDEERKNSFNCKLSLITKPQFCEYISSLLKKELQFDADGFVLFNYGFFVKGQVSTLVNSLTPTPVNFLVAAGKKFDKGNLELYYNSQGNVFGLQYSTQLDKSTDKESRLREGFNNMEISSPDTTSEYYGERNLTILHAEFGNTLEEAVVKVRAGGEQALSRLISLLEKKDHEGTFSARELYEKRGYGCCRDINGNFIPYIESEAFNYKKVYSVSLSGSFTNHAIAIIMDENEKYDLRNYENYYNLNAESENYAISKVFPGAYVYGDGTVSDTVSVVRDAVEKQLYDWKRFK